MSTTLSASGLTTGHAPFVEQARDRGELYISQPYGQYSEVNHESWRRLFTRMQPRWERYANPYFLHGIEALDLPHARIPDLAGVNARLQPLTGFRAKPVSGYVPGLLFFDCLRRREFPDHHHDPPPDRMDYLPEPDIFHDVAGHVPMHTEHGLRGHAGPLRRLRPHRRRHDGGHRRSCGTRAPTDQHHPRACRASSGSPWNSA